MSYFFIISKLITNTDKQGVFQILYNTLRKPFLYPVLHLFNAEFDSLVAFAKKLEETQRNNSKLIFMSFENKNFEANLFVI